MIRVLSSLSVIATLVTSALAQKSQGQQGPARGSGGAPEIDAALTGAAIALVLGGIFLITTARRRKLARS